MTPSKRAIVEHLFAEAEIAVYAVIDGAAAPGLLDTLYDLKPDQACLYAGQLAPDIAHVAPYVVKLTPETPVLDWLIAHCWGKNWGIFITSGADLRGIRRHLRSMLTVYDPEGKPVYFRYYDPRVLRVYLPTCNADETAIFFGPVQSFLAEDEDAGVLLRFKQAGALPHMESMIIGRVGEAIPKSKTLVL